MTDYYGFPPGFDSAIKAGIVPHKEYFLQGSILDDRVDPLLERLRGLCDDCAGPVEIYEDHEMCFVINWPPEAPLRLRVRRSLDHEEQPYLLRYVGLTETGDWSQKIAVRTSLDVGTSSNVVEFLEHMGFRKEFEFVSRGYLFTKGRMKITVSKINRAVEAESTLTVLAPVTGSYFVEMSVVEPAERHAKIGAEMKQFADCLKPLVYMDKVDYYRPA